MPIFFRSEGERYLFFVDNREVGGRWGDLVLGVREVNSSEATAFTCDPNSTASIRSAACFSSALRVRVYQLSCLYEKTQGSAVEMSDQGLRVRKRGNTRAWCEV